MRRFIVMMLFFLALSCPLLAQTQPAPLLTQPAVDLTATKILAQYTATAEAFPVPVDQVDKFGFFTFVLAMGSMLVVLLPVGYGFWRMNRGK